MSIVDAAEASGELKPGGTIVEATSGNTGIALAMVGAAGATTSCSPLESMSKERRALLRAFGAELVLTDPATGMKVPSARRRDRGRARRRPRPPVRQRGQPRDPPRATAEEIWKDTDGQVDIVVAGIGTGGTITGVGQVLKSRKPDVKIIAVEPEESPILNGGQPGRTRSRASAPTSSPRSSTPRSTTRSSMSTWPPLSSTPVAPPPRKACSSASARCRHRRGSPGRGPP